MQFWSQQIIELIVNLLFGLSNIIQQQLLKSLATSYMSTPTLNTLGHPDNFEQLQQIIQGSTTKSNLSSLTQQSLLNILQLSIAYIAKKQCDKFKEIAKQFSTYLSQNRQIYIHHQYLIDNFDDLKFMVCKSNKLFHLGKPNAQLRGYVIVGKAVSVHKRKKKEEQQIQNREERDQITNIIEQGIIRLIEDGKYILPKNQKNFNLDDILMKHDMPDSSVDQVYLGNQVHSPFVPVQKSIVLVVPSKIYKPECLTFVKGSLLHVFMDQVNLLNKIMTKELFYKNSVLKGLFFIDQGQVQVKSGRVIARGWTTYGKCKVSGFGWKFKPIPFIRFLIKNSAVWKQFFNDINLNNEYPFNIVHILSLNDEDDFTSSAQWRSLGRRKIGSKSPKLPKLNMGVKSVDQSKIQQIEKLRHYDDRLNDIFSYKQDLLTRKLKGIVHKKFQPIFRDEHSQQKLERKKKMILLRLNSKGSQFSKRELIGTDAPPSQNILIMSVLKRLQSIADMNQTQRRKQYSVSHELSERNHFFQDIKPKKQNVKILPMQLHQRSKQLRRNKRY